jgi:DNA-binding CsgD family transcriptional regulator
MNTISTIKTRIFEKTTAGNIKELMELATLYNVNY